MQVGLLVGIAAACRLLWFLGLPLTEQVKSIPDDAFYYLVLARNYAALGTWTFDGVAPASGFHPLHAFLLAGLSSLAPSASLYLTLLVVGAASAVVLALTAGITARILEDRVGGSSIWVVAALLTSPLVLLDVTELVGAPYGLLAGALAFRYALDPGRFAWVRAGAAGAFGSLARTDCGLLPAVMLLAALVLPLEPAVRRRLWPRLASLLAGASLGLGLFLLYAHGFSGNWIQSSARVKSIWAEQHGWDVRSYLFLLAVILLSKPFLAFAASTLLQAASALVRSTRSVLRGEGPVPSPTTASENRWIAASGILGVVGFILFYGVENPATPQTWYAANFLVPLALATGTLAGGALARLGPSEGWRAVTAAAVAAGALFSLWEGRLPRFPHQANVLAAGWWLKEHPQDRRVGAFNAGLLAWASETPVVNLDGLVNDDVVDYVRRNALNEYVDDHDVGYILDYPAMWLLPSMRQRGGYGDGELVRRLRPVHHVAPLEPRARWLRGHPVLMRIEPAR